MSHYVDRDVRDSSRLWNDPARLRVAYVRPYARSAHEDDVSLFPVRVAGVESVACRKTRALRVSTMCKYREKNLKASRWSNKWADERASKVPALASASSWATC